MCQDAVEFLSSGFCGVSAKQRQEVSQVLHGLQLRAGDETGAEYPFETRGLCPHRILSHGSHGARAGRNILESLDEMVIPAGELC